ncbi:hypothetical protein SAMN05216480_113101 [Pustulibacterium marinum]|uniref:TonB C-terminal domain-containing protein n=1 Tax=Pustulibacterium marinum TaxID=1224947 RepID=A0A1I7I8I6_9FLAO|nr:hypothetical protein [Pustulibacterium marinum]SFU69076.1 hypothetical protein SAMN05216480_113101 [Pustulibacterium marinum]
MIRIALKKEKSLKSINGTIKVIFKFGKEDVFLVEEFKGELSPAQQDKIIKIINSTAILTPAYYQNKPVDLYRRMSLPLKF